MSDRLSRRRFMRNAVVGASLSAFGSIDAPAAAGPTRPNIVFMLTDDQRWDAMSCAGNALLKTPNMDRLAREGALFENAFVTTSICAPNRACILAGQHQRTTGIKDFATPFTPEALDKTYPMVLKRAGYRVGFIGKWGVGAGTEKDLELPAGKFDYWRGFKQQGKYFHEIDGERRHLTALMADQAREFLKGCSPRQPFCLSISFKAPHGPWQDFDPALADMFTGEDAPRLPSSFSKEEFESLPQLMRDSLDGEFTRQRIYRDEEECRQKAVDLMSQYYRLVVGVDIAIGRIMDSLRELGFDKNTVVLFTGDNGHYLFERGLLGKWLMYETSIRIPLIVMDPRLPAESQGRRCGQMALSIDLAPTILALAGVRAPAGMQGMDLGPLVRGEPAEWREDWFYEHTFTLAPPRTIPRSQGVRTERWKYIKYLDPNPYHEELFDLKNDPEERKNLASDGRHEAVLADMRRRYEHYRKTLPDNNPTREEYGHYRDDEFVMQPFEEARDFSRQRSIGQSFIAEGSEIHSVRFTTPTWGKKAPAPAGLAVVLLENGPGGREIATGKVDAASIADNRAVTVRLDAHVEMGSTLYLGVRPQAPLLEESVGWWGYEGDVFQHGSAFIDGAAQQFDMAMTVTYKDADGFRPSERYARRKKAEASAKSRTFALRKGQELPHHRSPRVEGRAIDIRAAVRTKGKNGVIVAQGGSANGYALYVKDGRLCMALRRGGHLTKISADAPIPPTEIKIRARFDRDGAMTLEADGAVVASGKAAGPLDVMPGDGLEAGADHHTAVGDYDVPNPFGGEIRSAVVRIGEQ